MNITAYTWFPRWAIIVLFFFLIFIFTLVSFGRFRHDGLIIDKNYDDIIINTTEVFSIMENVYNRNKETNRRMKDICRKEKINDLPDNILVEPIINEYKCPTVIKDDPKFMCNKKSTFYYPLLSMVDFVHFLEFNHMTILYVGDSLQQQMYSAFLCAVEAEDPLFLKTAKKRVIFSSSSFMASIPHSCENHRPGDISELFNERWLTIAIT
jgi:hypothetical protein